MKRALLVATALLGCGGDPSTPGDNTMAPRSPEAVVQASPSPTPVPAEPATPEAHDFVDEARFLQRVAACGSIEGELPSQLSAAKIATACARQRKALDLYRARWLDKATPFFAELVPGDAPRNVVYPFGGGDLMTALAVFPDFEELTTLSLEPAGDPRGVGAMPSRDLHRALAAIHEDLRRLYRNNHSLTKKMITNFRGGSLPGHLIFSLAALEIHGLSPTAVYYFELADDGSIDYVSTAELEELAKTRSKKARNAAFGNVEIRFVKPGETKVRIYRHIMANLDNQHIADDRRALAHLEAKGKVSMMTKAASFLLWWDNFSTIRNYVLGHAAWMVSDATGVPPEHATAAGFIQETWGKFTGPILNPGQTTARTFRDLWKKNPKRQLAFRFGYPDRRGLNHLMVTRPAD